MNNFEIDNEMNNLDCYLGTFARDDIPNILIKKRPLGLIINTDPSNKPGTHWVALFINQNNCAEYFDSFGERPICCEIQNFLKINKIKCLKYNKYKIQSIFSSNCGAFCILYLKTRCNKFSFNEFIKLFTANKIYNDAIVERIIEN